MPIYAYKCKSCGFAKDVLQKLSDPVLTDCPACGEASFGKQLTAAGFQLKGSGWYATDFKGGSGGTSATSSTPADTGPAPESPAKTEAAPAASAAACGTGCACHS